ncbi:conserved hypothetical protein [Luminiphilus syltensis NOR5-1B]|uniref:Uncharacterized protein n=1 Tax=Luminiphilus syltensis NOR5-1B TaxID=565045 RepID=B8KW40_9GAMM|nr:conserved hypothetical protein [Luminiphilus syltensis NOR5-1B]
MQREGLAQEANEQWSAAVKTYQQALDIDGSVVFASDGLKRSEPRAELSKALEGVITERERLVDRSILEKAEQTLKQANTIEEPGAKLSRQIAEVTEILNYARTPVDMAFVSDGETDVTVLRVKRLGSFLQTQLTLRPGKYTAVGIRNGYRDVRINFEATPDQADGPIAVRCTEAI